MRPDLPLPANSFVVDQMDISYGDFDEVELGRQLVRTFLREGDRHAMKNDLRLARLTPYLYSNEEYGDDTNYHGYVASYWIIAHFKTNDEGVWFMLKHNMHPKRTLKVDKMSRQWLSHKNKISLTD